MTTTMTVPRTHIAGRAGSKAGTLADEHAQLLSGVLVRAAAVDSLIDEQTWPDRELAALSGYLQATLLRQLSDEENLLYPHDATSAPFAELSAGHARLYQLSQRLEQIRDHRCWLYEVRVLVDDLVTTLRKHFAAEEAVLGAVGGDVDVPATAPLSETHRRWPLAQLDGPVVIRLDALPKAFATRLCIERVLRLRPGEHASIYSCSPAQLHAVRVWLDAFDGLRFAMATTVHPGQEGRLDVSCREPC